MEGRSPFTHILVPTDGSETSIHAGRLAIQMAALHNAQVTLLYVVDSTMVEEIGGVTSKTTETIGRELEEKGQSYLDYLARLARQKNVEPTQVVRRGIPYWEIADLARELGVDLIVMGRVGCRGPRCAMIGSVAGRVIEYADCPVLVVSHASGVARARVRR